MQNSYLTDVIDHNLRGPIAHVYGQLQIPVQWNVQEDIFVLVDPHRVRPPNGTSAYAGKDQRDLNGLRLREHGVQFRRRVEHRLTRSYDLVPHKVRLGRALRNGFGRFARVGGVRLGHVDVKVGSVLDRVRWARVVVDRDIVLTVVGDGRQGQRNVAIFVGGGEMLHAEAAPGNGSVQVDWEREFGVGSVLVQSQVALVRTVGFETVLVLG